MQYNDPNYKAAEEQIPPELFGGSIWPFVIGMIALAVLWFVVMIEVLI